MMINEYQVFYRATAIGELDLTPKPVGELLETTVRATTHHQARSIILDAGYHVCSVGEARPLIDWGQRIFSRPEAGVYLRASSSLIDQLMAEGHLPKARNGRPVFTREMLDDVISKRMQFLSEERRAA